MGIDLGALTSAVQHELTHGQAEISSSQFGTVSIPKEPSSVRGRSRIYLSESNRQILDLLCLDHEYEGHTRTAIVNSILSSFFEANSLAIEELKQKILNASNL